MRFNSTVLCFAFISGTFFIPLVAATDSFKWASEEDQEIAFQEIEHAGNLQHADLLGECAAWYTTFNYEAARQGSTLRANEGYTGDPQKALVTAILMQLSSDDESFAPNTAMGTALSQGQEVYTYFKKEALYDVFEKASSNSWDNERVLEYMGEMVRGCVLNARFLTLRNNMIFNQLSSDEK